MLVQQNNGNSFAHMQSYAQGLIHCDTQDKEKTSSISASTHLLIPSLELNTYLFPYWGQCQHIYLHFLCLRILVQCWNHSTDCNWLPHQLITGQILCVGIKMWSSAKSISTSPLLVKNINLGVPWMWMISGHLRYQNTIMPFKIYSFVLFNSQFSRPLLFPTYSPPPTSNPGGSSTCCLSMKIWPMCFQ